MSASYVFISLRHFILMQKKKSEIMKNLMRIRAHPHYDSIEIHYVDRCNEKSKHRSRLFVFSNENIYKLVYIYIYFGDNEQVFGKLHIEFTVKGSKISFRDVKLTRTVNLSEIFINSPLRIVLVNIDVNVLQLVDFKTLVS